jgi:hypothetical protein
MTKLISILIILVILFGGWELFKYWEKIKDEREISQKEAAASVVVPQSLPGLPEKLEPSLQAVQKQGAAALRNWLTTYGQVVQDPRKAWIELDYCVMAARENPADARRVFAAVKERTPPSSPVWPRIHDLEKSYQ